MSRVCVFVCHCGENIARNVKIQQVVEFSRNVPGAAVTADYPYLCSAPGQQMVIDAIKEHDLDTYAKKGYESPTVNCISAPDGMSGPDVYNAMRTHGFELAQGYGDLKSSTFRVGNMGWIPDEYIAEMLAALGKVVS